MNNWIITGHPGGGLCTEAWKWKVNWMLGSADHAFSSPLAFLWIYSNIQLSSLGFKIYRVFIDPAAVQPITYSHVVLCSFLFLFLFLFFYDQLIMMLSFLLFLFHYNMIIIFFIENIFKKDAGLSHSSLRILILIHNASLRV
jgi:hypothetical protein